MRVKLPDSPALLQEEVERAEEISGKLGSQFQEDKLMKSVMQNDKETIDDGKVLNEAINNGMQSFTPDLAFQQITQNYAMAEKIMGERLISLLAGYDANYVKKNINIPEFKRELQGNISSNIQKLKDKDLIDREGFITNKGVELASMVLYMQEMENMLPQGNIGEKIHKKVSHYGDKGDARIFRKGDRYKDIAVKKSVHLALRRGHKHIQVNDLKTFERESKGQISLIYALDASGSMKGKKIETCKKAGVSLAYKAIEQKDKVGLVVFGSEVTGQVEPTLDFASLLKSITTIRASKETNFHIMMQKAIEMFPNTDATKHLVILTDAQPTVGDDPQEKALQALSDARAHKITVSLIGIDLDDYAQEFAKKAVEIGGGRLYLVQNLEELNQIVLEDYYSLM